MNYKNCPVCGSTQLKPFLKVKGFRLSRDPFKIDECSNCSYKLTNPLPDESEIGEYYMSDNYISHTSSNKGFLDKVYQLVRRYAIKSKYKIIKKHVVLDQGLVVDYGCGTGSFLEFVHSKNHKVQGFEPSEIAVSNSSSEIKKYISSPDSFQNLKSKSVSALTLWHVFEHIYNFNAFLASARTKLKDDGCLFIAVPNHESFDAVYYKESWAAWDVPIHHSHFNKSAIKKVFDKNGFQLIEVINMPFDGVYISMLSEELKHGKKRHLNALWVGLKSNFLGVKSKNMSSLIYVAKKA